jgi:hypothetical protein
MGRENRPARIAHLSIHEWLSCYLNSSCGGFQKQNNSFHDNFWSIAPQSSWQPNTCWWRHHRWAPGFFFYPLLENHMDLPEYKSDLHLFIVLNLVLIFLNAICFVLNILLLIFFSILFSSTLFRFIFILDLIIIILIFIYLLFILFLINYFFDFIHQYFLFQVWFLLFWLRFILHLILLWLISFSNLIIWYLTDQGFLFVIFLGLFSVKLVLALWPGSRDLKINYNWLHFFSMYFLKIDFFFLNFIIHHKIG